MAIQKEVDLNQPVQGTGEAKLEFSKLTPELVKSTLELHGDYYAKLEGQWVKSFLWSTPVVSLTVAIIAGYFYYVLKDYIEVSESFKELLGLITRSTDLRVGIITVFPVLAISLALFGITALFLGDEFRIMSKRMDHPKYIDEIFGFEILKFARLPNDEVKTLKESKLADNGNNSQIVLYKGEPIGLITLKPLFDKSNDSNLVIKITGLHVRQAFKPLDFEELLLSWATERSKTIYTQYLKDKKIKASNGCKITLLADNYSFNDILEACLSKHQFSKVSSSYKLNPVDDNTALLKGSLNPFLKLSRDTYALHIVDKS